MSEEFWSNFARREAQRNHDNPEDYIYYRLVSHTLTSFVSREDSVLDIGGGPGRFSLDLAPLVKTVSNTLISHRRCLTWPPKRHKGGGSRTSPS